MIQLDNPSRSNVIDRTMLTELRESLTEADLDPEVNGILLGTTGEVFCGGADLTELKDLSFEEGSRWLTAYLEVVKILRDTGKPTIAAVRGACAAGGNELAMACDLVVAGETAQFGQPEVGVGSTAAGGGVQLLPLIVGEKRAREMLLLGGMIAAPTALEWGLINRVVPDVEVQTAARSMMTDILDNHSPQAYRTIKTLLNGWTTFAMGNQGVARDLTALVWSSDEFAQRAQAFLDGETQTARPFTGSQFEPDE